MFRGTPGCGLEDTGEIAVLEIYQCEAGEAHIVHGAGNGTDVLGDLRV
ncbi:MAG: hypothetical protein V3W43_13700 [Desulfatiglandaceae bacterium]